MTVSIEDFDGGDAPYCRVDGVAEFLKNVSGLQFSFDTGNFVMYHDDEEEAFELFKDKICTVHLKDRCREKDLICDSLKKERPFIICADGEKLYTVPVGDGFIHIKEILSMLKQQGYDGGFIIEMYGYSAENMYVGIRKSVKQEVKLMEGMKYANHLYINKKISRIFYGTAMMPFLAGEDGSGLLDAMYGLGVNSFDIARGYGGAECSVGRWVEERGIREDVVLLSKCAHPDSQGNKRVNEKAIREDFAMSSEALRSDYIDIYLLHRDDLDVPAGEIVEIMNALYAEGKIRAFGGSNWTHQRIAEANEYAGKHNLVPFTVSSPNFGLAEQIQDPWGGGCITISGPQNKAARLWYKENQMPVIAYSSLGRGLFSGKLKSGNLECASKVLDEFALRGYGCPENYERLCRCEELAEKKHCTVTQIAMAWIYSQKLNTFAVVSTSSAKRMRDNIEALHIKLTDEECAYLDLQK